MHTETQRGRLRTACGQRRVDIKNSQTTPATTSTSSIRQLLGAADTQTAHPATSSTAPTHQTTGLCERRNDTSKSSGRSGRQNAATQRNMRREERVTVQGPVKEQQPDGMSHGGGNEAETTRSKIAVPHSVCVDAWPAPLHLCTSPCRFLCRPASSRPLFSVLLTVLRTCDFR